MTCAVVALSALLAVPSWRVEPDEDVLGPRIELRTSVGRGEFRRPERACRSIFPGGGPGFCPAVSEEAVLGFGAAISIRADGPFYFSFGLDLARTETDGFSLAPQTFITLPFGFGFRWSEWPVRPVFEALIIPFALLPDGVKNVMVGGRVGAEVPVGPFDIGASIGYAHADEVQPLDFRLAIILSP